MLGKILYKISKEKHLFNAIITFVSSFVTAICNWGQLSLLTKSINLELLGIYTLSLAVINPLFQFLNLQLRMLYVTDRKDKISFTSYFNLRIITTLFAGFLTLIIGYFLFGDLYSNLILYLVFASYGIDAIIEIFNSRLHYNEELDKVGYSIILRSILGFIGLYLGIWISNDVVTALLISFIFKILSLVFFDYVNFDNKQLLRFNFKDNVNFKKIILLGVPLGGGLLISSLNINIPKYLINMKYGVEMQGVFSSMSFIIVLGNMSIGTVANVMLPKMSTYFSINRLKEVRILTLGLNLLSLIIGLVLLLFAYWYHKEIVTLCFSESISEYSYLLVPIFVSAIFMYLNSAIGYSLITARLNKFIFKISCVSLLLHIVVGYFLLNYMELETIIYLSGFIFLGQYLVSLLVLFKKI